MTPSGLLLEKKPVITVIRETLSQCFLDLNLKFVLDFGRRKKIKYLLLT